MPELLEVSKNIIPDLLERLIIKHNVVDHVYSCIVSFRFRCVMLLVA